LRRLIQVVLFTEDVVMG